MADQQGNQDPGAGAAGAGGAGNQDPGAGAGAGAAGAGSPGAGSGAAAGTVSWKSGLRTDLRDSPFMQKFEDTPDGLNKAIESHGNLEKLLGHEKVPIPKGIEDVEGWNRFSKAMGIPDKAEGYGLSDVTVPENMKGLNFDKNKFAEIAHSLKLTPGQAKGLWETYTQTSMQEYKGMMEKHQKSLTETVNKLKGEWGDAYQQKVEMGQMVINKFSADQEMNDYITTILCQDPRGIKFLAKIGDQFAENKVGEFAMSRFTLAPEQAQEEIDKIKGDINGAYMNQAGKFSAREHNAEVDRVNSLIASIQRAKR